MKAKVKKIGNFVSFFSNFLYFILTVRRSCKCKSRREFMLHSNIETLSIVFNLFNQNRAQVLNTMHSWATRMEKTERWRGDNKCSVIVFLQWSLAGGRAISVATQPPYVSKQTHKRKRKKQKDWASCNADWIVFALLLLHKKNNHNFIAFFYPKPFFVLFTEYIPTARSNKTCWTFKITKWLY